MPRRSAATSDGEARPNAATKAAMQEANLLMGRDTSQTVAAGQLRAFIERIERLTEEKQAIQGDISDVYSEAKGTGFDTRAIRELIKERKVDPTERQERESILDLYKSALGMI